MDISFLLPINFSLDVLEIDDYTPSLCAMISYSYNNNNRSINGHDKFWFLKSDWISFISQIRYIVTAKDVTSAQLVDIERNFCLSIYKKHESIFFQLRIYYCDYYTDRLRLLNIFRSPIDFDVLHHVVQPFLDFPIWNDT
jgi:hypothetical protein